MFNIQEFASSIASDGVQHNSHFDVMISTPLVLIGKINVSEGFSDVSYNDHTKILTMRCDKAVIPGIMLKTRMNNRHGLGLFEKYPVSPGVTDINLSFLTDKNMFIPKYFYTWMNLITNFSDTKELYGRTSKRYVTNFKSEYITTIKINKYDSNGSRIGTIVLTKAFPFVLNDQGLDWQDNSLSRTTVGITFKDWYFENNTTQLARDLSEFDDPRFLGTFFNNPNGVFI